MSIKGVAINKQKFIEFYVNYVWPSLRHVVRISKRCENCIISEKYEPLKGGLCSACASLVSRGNLGQEPGESSENFQSRFEERIKSCMTADRSYHALLLLSGGKDSAYILDRMKIEFPELNILCLFVDNGFSSPFALKNVQYLAEKTKTDIILSYARIPEFADAFRKAFLSLEGKGSYGVVDYADGSMIFETGLQVAADLDIPVVIGGLTWVQVKMICGKDDFELLEEGQPNTVFPLAVWKPNEQHIRETCRNKKLLLPGSDSPVVSNNDLILTQVVVDFLNLGYSSFEPEFAQLVREGKTDRKTWLHLFELLEYASTRGYLNKDVEKSLKKLNLSINDVVKEAK